MTTQVLSRVAAEVQAECGSRQLMAVRPMRVSFCWRSSPTKELAPTPKLSRRRAESTSATARPSAPVSSVRAVSAMESVSFIDTLATISSSVSSRSMSPDISEMFEVVNSSRITSRVRSMRKSLQWA